MKYDPIDVNGKDLKVGDWVLVICVPLSIGNMPDDSKAAFSKAVRKTLQIESIDIFGCFELCFGSKLKSDTILIEPFCARRFRRYKKLSK